MDRPPVPWKLGCTACGELYRGSAERHRCGCGGTLDVVTDLDALRGRVGCGEFDRRLGSRAPLDRSGVWRFRELVLPLEPQHVVTKPEGNTNLYSPRALSAYVGVERLRLKHEGENPTGSFKDRGMTVAISVARSFGAQRVACASTGNTAASLAAYAAEAGLEACVFLPAGGVAHGKLMQALAHGARVIEVEAGFDRALALVEELCESEGIALLNSLNPFRIEGQKAIVFELLQDLEWRVPDWIVLPGGNLGNTAAAGKALHELRELGLIARVPRLAVVQAAGAAPLVAALAAPDGAAFAPWTRVETVASAIRIGNPVSWRRALRALRDTAGVAVAVPDQEILDAKARLDAAGIGAEPASAATVAGIRHLVATGVIQPGDEVVGILTGHLLKDPEVTLGYHRAELPGIDPRYRNEPRRAPAELDALRRLLGS